jgi:hypothetical protein
MINGNPHWTPPHWLDAADSYDRGNAF